MRAEPASAAHGERARVRVLIAEDEPSVRTALASLVDADDSLELVAAAADAAEAIDLAVEHRPEVALLDVKMPHGGGPRAAREIRARSPQTRVVALSAHDDRASVLEMLRAGALAYLVKGAQASGIVEAIHRAARGQASLSADVAADIVQELAGQLQQQEFESEDRRQRLERVQALLAEGAIKAVFQPIIDMENRKMVGLEALARFPAGSDRGPDAWFADAETVGMRLELELAAIRTAVSHLPRLPSSLFASINLSPATATSEKFLDELEGIAPGRIVIEVTEHAPVDDYDVLNESLQRLRTRGIRLAIDDAGAGFASLRHIVRLAPDFIKLDMTLTRSIDSDPVRRALATALISFSGEIGATMIAEGIETRGEFDTLRSLGVAYGQGYHLGVPRPLPAAGGARGA